MKEAVVKRIQELKEAIQHTINNHALLTGQLTEAEFLLKTIFNAECQANPAIGAVAGTVEAAVPAIEAAIPAVESAVHAVEGAIEGKPVTAS